MTGLMRLKGALGVVLVVGVVLSVGMAGGEREGTQEEAMQVRFLEIVTPELEATIATLEAVHGVTFGEAVPELGNARTAALRDGGVVSVRAPMRSTETPVVRPYVLTDDIDAAVKTAKGQGAEIAIGPMEIPGQGRFAIYILGGIEHGLWED
jgi:predicted enzyme related to lactoylglutathione lyase